MASVVPWDIMDGKEGEMSSRLSSRIPPIRRYGKRRQAMIQELAELVADLINVHEKLIEDALKKLKNPSRLVVLIYLTKWLRVTKGHCGKMTSDNTNSCFP